MRNASRRPAVLVLLAIVASLFGVITPTAAQAVSAYDDAIRYSSGLTVKETGYPNVDVSHDWYSRIQNQSGSGCTTQAKTALADAVDHGQVAVTEEHDAGGASGSPTYRQYARVFWRDDTDGEVTWSTLGSTQFARVNFEYYAILYRYNGTFHTECGGSSSAPISNTQNSVSGYDNWYVYYSTFDVTYPSGYEGAPIRTEPPAAKYVAMGDSFSSGEGNAPFEAGTDTGSNKCHRSPLAYPRLLQNDASLSLESTSFVACSGATTSNVLNGGSADGAWGENPQIDALSIDTEVVTITIGGNNVGFKAFATACTIGSCDFATTAYTDIHGKIVNDLPGALADVYEAIDNATASTANIYVVGYPQIAPAEMPTGANSACYPLNGGADNPDPELNDGATAYAVVSELNSVIYNAVNNMNPAKFHFVDPNLSGSPFIGHDWCQQDRYFVQIGVPIPPSNTEYSFHPNADGQAAYKTVVEGAMS